VLLRRRGVGMLLLVMMVVGMLVVGVVVLVLHVVRAWN
jgi:hypothetical protein